MPRASALRLLAAGATAAAVVAGAATPRELAGFPLAGAGDSPATFTEAFDCTMRNMALEMAFRLQPDRPLSFFQEIADAFNGTPEKPANCTVEVPAAVARAVSGNARTRHVTMEYLRSRITDGLTFYVDPVNGNDENPGTESLPFKTIPFAITSTRASPGFNTIVLRAGTHYPGQTIVLTEADSGLEFLAYPGEEVWISGATPLVGNSVSWQPYNVSSTGPQWVDYPNTTTVYAAIPGPGISGAGIPFLGYLKSADACKSACIGTPGCTAYTWHDQQQGEYALCCWGRTDGQWTPQPETGHYSGHLDSGPNIWSTSLVNLTSGPAGNVIPNGALGMRSGVGRNITRLQRARYPNWNSEISFGPSFQAGWTKQQAPALPAVQIDLASPVRNVTPTMFHTFTAGIGGTCDRFQPNAGYWCSTNVQGGGSVIYSVPIALNVTQQELPHTPYANPQGGIVMTWRPGHWASWMAEIGDWSYDAATGATNFSIARGLFQGSRGADTGDEVYVENIFEELDAPGEWFYNASTNTLFLFQNVTLPSGGGMPSPPPTDGSIAVVSLKHLFNVTGSSMSSPASNIAFYGVGFRDTAYTYMDPHGIPSGGDWTLERSAVLFAENTVGLTVDGCVFERVDGNAIVLSAFTRNATITHNEFAWTGASAIAQWGNTHGGDDRLPPGYGLDGSQGDQPRGTVVSFNYARELGIWQKQSSFYTQFKSSENVIVGNVAMNGPRAHVNFNDGFRGGSVLANNVLLNACRESSDHGPFNSWDRDRATWDLPGLPAGEVSMVKLMDTIRHNLVFANYFSLGFVDNDDGSWGYNITQNVALYGNGGLKNDFEGANGHASSNIFAFVQYGVTNGYGGLIGTPGQSPYQLPQYADTFVNNTVYQINEQSYGYSNIICQGDSATTVANNAIYTPSGNITECGMPIAQWQAQGHDQGTVVRPAAAADPLAFVALARSILAGGVPEMAKPLL